MTSLMREELGGLCGDIAKVANLGSKVSGYLPRDIAHIWYVVTTGAEGFLYWAKDRALFPDPSEPQPKVIEYLKDLWSMDRCDAYLRREGLDKETFLFWTFRDDEYERIIQEERNSLPTTIWRDKQKERQNQIVGGEE